MNANNGRNNVETVLAPEAIAAIARYANGDARVALNVLELAAAVAPSHHRSIRQ